MPGTLCSLWSGIDWKTWAANRPKGQQPDGHMLEKAFADGVFTVQDRHLTGMHNLGEGLAGGNIGHTYGVDGTDERSVTEALVFGRKSMKEYERYYRGYLKGFENVRLVDTGSLLGVRETRRITGDYVLGIADYKARAVFPDEIGRYAYPIDIQPLTTDKASYEKHRKEFDEEYRYKKGESYGIPYRVLTPKGFDNLLVAGRCVSTDQRVHGSLRVMPGCFITGQAAGVAAAMCADDAKSVRAADVNECSGDSRWRICRMEGERISRHEHTLSILAAAFYARFSTTASETDNRGSEGQKWKSIPTYGFSDRIGAADGLAALSVFPFRRASGGADAEEVESGRPRNERSA